MLTVVQRDMCLQAVHVATPMDAAEAECNKANATLAKLINNEEMSRARPSKTYVFSPF